MAYLAKLVIIVYRRSGLTAGETDDYSFTLVYIAFLALLNLASKDKASRSVKLDFSLFYDSTMLFLQQYMVLN